jgi:hypothetical protein
MRSERNPVSDDKGFFGIFVGLLKAIKPGEQPVETSQPDHTKHRVIGCNHGNARLFPP